MAKSSTASSEAEVVQFKTSNLANTIHFVLQGKGGIGKSFSASLLAQWGDNKGVQVKCYDTDQQNLTLANYKALSAQHIPVKGEGHVIDPKKFDSLMEQLLTTDGVMSVVDNGSNTYSPLLAYMVENHVIDFLRENGKRVYIHTVVGGGAELADTRGGFDDVARNIDAPVVLWLNEHFGDLEDFLHGPEIKAHEAKIAGVVLLEDRTKDTYGADIKRMTKEKLTIREVMESPEYKIMEKQRIRVVQKAVFEQLDKAEF